MMIGCMLRRQESGDRRQESPVSCSPVSCLQDTERRVPARRAHDAAARVRRGAAHIEVADGRLVLRPAGRGTQEEELLERQLALKDVAFRQSPLALEIEGGDDLTVQ